MALRALDGRVKPGHDIKMDGKVVSSGHASRGLADGMTNLGNAAIERVGKIVNRVVQFQTKTLPVALAIFLAAPAIAEPPASYAVTYIELKTDHTAAGARALRDYAAASRQEKANLEFQVAEESARPNRFNILEAWSSRDALDAHYHNATTQELLSRLAPARAAPDDRRMYDALYASAPLKLSGNRPGAVTVMTHVDVMPPFADGAAALLKAMRAETPRDPGNIGYDILRQQHEPNHFTVAEVWASRRAFEAHLAAVHTVSFRQKLLPMTGALYDERLFTQLW
jgi:quinol monooxygenase YgiN